jgi:hypothetical protein
MDWPKEEEGHTNPKYMKGFLEVPTVTEPVQRPIPKLKDIPEGQAFLKARDSLHLVCRCAREADPPKRMLCCDSWDEATLRQRAREAFGHAY